MCDKGKIKIIISEKFKIIKTIIEKYNLKNKVSYLCNIANVSRSGYYNYFSSDSTNPRNTRDTKDLESYNNILSAFNFKNRKKVLNK